MWLQRFVPVLLEQNSLFNYKKPNSLAVVQVDSSAVQEDFSYYNTLRNLATEVLGSEWTNVVREMPLVRAPSSNTVPVLFATDVTLT